jgi:hypothetical protein
MAEQGDAISDEHGNTSDDQPLNESRSQEALNSNAAVHVNMANASRSELRQDFRRISRRVFDESAGRGRRKGTAAEYKYGLLFIRPSIKSQNDVKSLAPDDQSVDSRHEFRVAVGFRVRGKEIEGVIASSNVAIETRGDKD